MNSEAEQAKAWIELKRSRKLKTIEKALVDAVNEIENFSDKMAYYNILERRYNKTGLSLMELGDTEEGRLKAADISRKIGKAMADKFGPGDAMRKLGI